MTLPDILSVRDLRLGYGRVVVLHGVSFEVPTGGIVAIVGPNGAGKSSTFGAVAGGVQIASGAIRFEGNPIAGRPKPLPAAASPSSPRAGMSSAV
jgi:branched-chain amino acid transport system ATP-binding protein